MPLVTGSVAAPTLLAVLLLLCDSPSSPRSTSSLSVAAAADAPEADPLSDDYYRVLGIPREATKKEVKKAYRTQALKWHPDKNQDKKEESEKMFHRIAEAYEVLSDEEARKVYDRRGKGGFSGSQGGGPGGGGFDFKFKGADSIFKDFFGGKDPFADFEKFFGDGFEETVEANVDPAKIAALKDFYISVQKPKYATDEHAEKILKKYAGKGDKLYKRLANKYPEQTVPDELKVVEPLPAAGNTDNDSGGFGGGFGAFGDMFKKMGGGGGRKRGGGGGGFGGKGSSFSSSFSFSSSSSSSSGSSFERTETKWENGKRVTKKIRSDGADTVAEIEEEEGGRTRKRKGRNRGGVKGKGSPHDGLGHGGDL